MYERKPHPRFVRGCLPGDPAHLRSGMKVPNFSSAQSSLPFILELRPICEVIFDIMLRAYVAGLTVNLNKCDEQGKKDSRRQSFDAWDLALQSAERALAGFREGECQRQAGEFDLADATVEKALQALQERYKFSSCAHLINNSLLYPSTSAVPIQHTPHPIMKDWDRALVRVV